MERGKVRVLSLLLAVSIIVGMLPIHVTATEAATVLSTEISSEENVEESTEALQENTEESTEVLESTEASTEALQESTEASTEALQESTEVSTEVLQENAESSAVGGTGVALLSDPYGVSVAAGVDYPIYVLAGGDFQEAGDHANSAENVTNILAQVSQKYTTMDGFLFIGDYDCETHDSATETASGITALMGAVQGKYSNLTDDNSVLVQGNHDYMDSRIDATGGHDFTGYSVFVLNEDDYPNGGGSQSGIQTLANNLKTWLNNKIGEGYSEPIFIVSHLPLAFTPRTVTQGDAKYAKYIFDVLNDAGANGLNIIFMHGHDHAYGPDNYMGGEAIYLAEDDKINIAEAGSTSAWTEETLNFTYMNAGYTGYYSDAYTYNTTAGTDKLTMTVFAITDNQVTVERYSADGLYNLKSAGRDGSYSDTNVTASSLGLMFNSDVYSSPQTIALAKAEEHGSIGSYVGVEAETPVDDVTTSGNSWVEITEPVPGTEATPGSTSYQYTLDTDGVNTNSAYLIVDFDDAKAMGNGTLTAVNTTISGSTATMSSQEYEWTITSDGKITNGTYWLAASIDRRSGSVSLTTNESDAYAWNISHSGGGTYQITGKYSGRWTTTYYLRYSNNDFSITSSSRNTVRLYGDVQTITTPGTEATPDTNGLYGKLIGNLTYNVAVGTSADAALAAVKAGIDGYYYGAMSTPGSDVAGIIDDDSVLTWTLDPNYNGNVAGDYAVTISYNGTYLGTAEVIVPATTIYYVAEGNGLYLVDMNTSADDAMAAVKAGVTVYSATDANGTNKTAVDDANVTWNWIDTYNGADSGPYTVEILYNGTSLGTVEVKVNVKYETGIAEGWKSVGSTTGGYKYVLDTDGIEYGESNKYIIVAADQAQALHATRSSNGTAKSITISGTTATTTTRDYEYHFIKTAYNGTRYELITKGDGSQYLYQESNEVRYGTRSSVKFQINHHGNGVYDIHDIDGTNWYVIYNGSWTVKEDTSARVRLYKYDSEIVGGEQFAKIEGNTVYTVDQGTSATQAMAAVKAGITGYISSNADGSNATELKDSELTWKWKNTYTSMYTGSYWVEISYNGVVLGTVEVVVEPAVVNNYPEYPDEGAVKVNKTATGIDFQSSGIAQIELAASGVPTKKGVDVIVMLDTSSSMAYCLNCTDTRHSTYECDKGGQTRAQALKETLADLIAQFKTPGDDGQLLDIDVAIADFNGFYGDSHSESGTPFDRDAADMMSDDISYTANSAAKIYTSTTGVLDATAFIAAEDLEASYPLNYASGTNYDYAFDAIYQMATAKKIANGSEDRDLYVIFMSDGAAMQWNYYHSQGESSLWNSWITGAWDGDDLTTTNLNCTTHAYYYDEVDHDGDGYINEHRMANAIKGDPSENFEVIRKTADLGTATSEDNMYMVPGLAAKMFSIAFDPRVDTNITVDSMTKSIASLASDQTGTTQYFYNVTSAGELASAFTAIGNEIAYAASNARFVDQMGDNFNLQMTPIVDLYGNAILDSTGAPMMPSIEIISYDIYTKAEADEVPEGTDGDDVTEAMIGQRKGSYTVLETVTFTSTRNEDESYTVTGAYSDQINGGATNILADGTTEGYVKGVIYAKTFLYNTNILDVAVDGVNIPTATKADGTTTGTTNKLPSETFYWKLGTVQTSELAMRYYVYLEGSMEGTQDAGSYATNEYAILYYDNYLGNACQKDTVSPTVAWKSANVSYAFYLVNEDGEIIVNQTTGQTGSFANKIAITNPVVYEEILLNNTDQVQAIDVAAIDDDVLPKYYTLYDSKAVYEVTINSDATGAWKITKDEEKIASTYVTNFGNSTTTYSNELTMSEVGNDYTHTVVWFAVVWKVQAHPDAVVIDYGLPVDISVLTNDMFGENGKLVGVGAYSDSVNLEGYDTAMASGFGSSYKGIYGVATANTTTGKVRYTLNASNGMHMQTYEKFAYAINYTGTTNPGYYYDTITVIPATTIYYEDDFLTYTGSNTTWEDAGAAIAGATQDEDRPGAYSLTDANNIYGYDKVNLNMSTYSLGSAKKVHVDANSYAKAEFTFYGTGFDVIGMTSNTTGMLAVKVTAAEDIVVDGVTKYAKGTKVKASTVNTYYGYSYNETTNEWVAMPDTANALYQVPVMQIEELPYGKYNVLITATYVATLDKTSADGYDLYLDAIRIYDPANDGMSDGTVDTTIEDAYKADGEGWPTYIELRNQIIDPDSDGIVKDGSLGNDDTSTVIEGLVFIDGDASVGDAQITSYISYGPNNEVYLAPGQSVAFILSMPANVANVHLGVKSADGGTGTYTITNIAQVANTETGVEAGDYYGAKTSTVSTTTDMYYNLTGWKKDIIVISNTGDRYDTDGIISLTNIKVTFAQDPNATSTTDDGITLASFVYMTPAAANLTLRTLNSVAVVETPDVEEIPDVEESLDSTGTEVTEPEDESAEVETTEPKEEGTEAEATEPEEESTEIEATEPEDESTEIEATEPENEETEITESEIDVDTGIGNIIKNFITAIINMITDAFYNLFGRWFR